MFRIDDLKKFNCSPLKGTYMIYTRKKVYYGHYDNDLLSVLNNINNEEILEIHLFDTCKEYRVIVSRTKGILETIVEGKEDTITEEILLENCDDESINLVSYISYDDNGMARIKDYCLQEVE